MLNYIFRALCGETHSDRVVHVMNDDDDDDEDDNVVVMSPIIDTSKC